MAVTAADGAAAGTIPQSTVDTGFSAAIDRIRTLRDDDIGPTFDDKHREPIPPPTSPGVGQVPGPDPYSGGERRDEFGFGDLWRLT
jgi:hypothetical protein